MNRRRAIRGSKDRVALRWAVPFKWSAWAAAFVIAGIAAVSPATSAGSTAGLIGSWTLNETSGTVAHDASDNGDNGVISPGVVLGIPGASGTASGFSASAGSAVDIPYGTGALAPSTTQITVSAWIDPSDLSCDGSDQCAIASNEAPSGSGTWGYGIRLINLSGPTLQFCWGGQDGPGDCAYGPYSPALGTWANVVGTYNGSVLTEYVNGVLVGSQPEVFPALNTTSDFVIGRLPSGELPFDGGIQDVRVFDRVLSPAEIVNQAQPNQGPAFTTGPAATFDEGTSGTDTVTATGIPTPSLSESGSLPPGVSFQDNGDGTATLSGIPTAAGIYPITLTASNGAAPDATQAFTLTVPTPTPPRSPWTGSGTGTTNVVSDGTSGPATFHYNAINPQNDGISGSWSFSTTSNFSGPVKLPWVWTGFHAFFEVTADLSAFVTHNGTTTTTSLVNAGPVNCCSPPSGGFTYTGTTTLTVASGDTYGFMLSGSNADSNATLQGTLTIGPTIASTATGTAALGGTIGDSATLTNTASGAAGTITFNAYSDSACATAPVHTNVVTVDGDGTYTDPGFAPMAAGTYYWTASYSGDPATNTLGSTGACGATNESSLVTRPTTTIAATASGPVAVGGTIGDSATLTNTAAGAGGTITFKAYSDSACATTPADTKVVPVNGDNTYVDPGFVPTIPGVYYWTVSYSGDAPTGTPAASEACGGANQSSTVTDLGNDTWSGALPISLDGNGDGGTTGALNVSGQARWYKVDVTPGGSLQVDLTNLPANYDLAVFSDIGQAYNSVDSTTALQTVSAEFGTNAFSPSVFSPSVFSPSVFSPSVFSPSVFSPSVFSPSVFSPSVFSPSVFSPSVFSPSVFSPSVFSPSVFSPSVFSPDPTAYEGAQVRSLLGISANDGTASEHVFADIWNNTGSFYIRVNGRNGGYDPGAPFTLSVHEDTGTCGGVVPSGEPLLAPGASVPSASLKTLVLTDYSRMSGGSDLQTMESKVSAFAGETGGQVVDVNASPEASALYTQADANPGCSYAQNLVAGSIKDLVSAYRAQNPSLKYIVIVGDDHVIPFFRYPDTAGIGPESSYDPPVLDTSASQASLQSNDFLSQDAYGSSNVLHLQGIDLPIPDLPVGRLVETPTEISGMLDAYMGLSGGVVPTPTSSLVTGYDFMASGAQSVESDLSAGLGPGATNDQLITNEGVSPSDTGEPPLHSWTAAQLNTALVGQRHDLMFLAGHFSADNTLAADDSTTLNATALADSDVDLANSIVFSAGCHSGYSIVPGDAVPGVTQTLDWVEAFAQKQATLIAGTGYQYGDTDFLAYSEQLYANFAHQLRMGSGPVAVGNALVQAEQTYLTGTPNLQGIDVKSLLEATLYGLPMLSVDLPAGRITAPASTSIVGSTTPFAADPGATLGLSFFDHDFAPTLETNNVQLVDANGNSAGQPTATYLSGPDGVESNPAAPTLPLATSDVSVGGGNVLRGVGFLGGTYSDQSGITPLTGAPATELSSPHSPFVSSAFFPSRLWSVNYFGGLTGGSSSSSTELELTPTQYESDAPGSLTDTQRTFSSVNLRLFYSANTSTYDGNTPALAAPPTIARVDANASNGTVDFAFHVVGDPSAGIQQAWVTYTGVDPGTWESLQLTQDATDSTLWTGSLSGLSPDQIAGMRFIAQAVNGVGLVSLDDNEGSYYQVDQIPPALQTRSAALTSTTLQLSSPPAGGDYGTSVPVSATLTDAAGPVQGEQVSFSVDGSSVTAQTDANGVASAVLPLVDLPGSYELSTGFDGDASLAGASDSSPFTIASLASSLSLSGDSTAPVGTDTGISATLRAGSVGLAQRTIAFVLTPTAGGTPVIQTRVTNLFGTAALGLVSGLPGGIYAVTAYFGPGGPLSLPTDPVYRASTSGSAQLTVTLPQAITFGSTPPASPVYRGSYRVAATGGASGQPVVLSIDTTSDPGACSISGSQVSFTGVGACVIDANQAAVGIYTAAPQVQQTLTIKAAQLTVAANNQSRSFGQANAALSATITGFVGGDTLGTSGVHGAPACTTTATAASPGGTYSITCLQGTLAASNYSFTFAPGTLTVSYTKTITGSVTGKLTVSAGQSVLLAAGASVTGPLTVEAGGSLDVERGTVTGPFTSTGAAAVRLCKSTITGPTTITGSTVLVVSGDDNGDPVCAGNKFTGPVKLTGNHAGVEFDDNAVTGPLTITGNTGPVDAVGNATNGPVTIQH